jgi:hypothetical protein
MTKHTDRRRTIGMPPERARAIALATTYLGCASGEAFIQDAISSALSDLASRDRAFAHMLARIYYEDL